MIPIEFHKIFYKCTHFGNFTLASGETSPFYMNFRNLVSDQESLKKIGRLFCEKILFENLSLKGIAAIPFSALPIGFEVGRIMGYPLIYVRPPKNYGTKASVEGIFQEGAKFVLIDDVISSGVSKVDAIKVLREAGLVVKDLVVLVDRRKISERTNEIEGCKIHSIFKAEDILHALISYSGKDESLRAVKFLNS